MTVEQVSKVTVERQYDELYRRRLLKTSFNMTNFPAGLFCPGSLWIGASGLIVMSDVRMEWNVLAAILYKA
jgi:hypothetical protein